MPQDIQRSVVPMAPSIERSPDSPKMRPWRVAFEIKGEITIFEEDLEKAQRLSEEKDKYEYAFYGALETFPPEPVQ